jgi:hypothetical protein
MNIIRYYHAAVKHLDSKVDTSGPMISAEMAVAAFFHFSTGSGKETMRHYPSMIINADPVSMGLIGFECPVEDIS